MTRPTTPCLALLAASAFVFAAPSAAQVGWSDEALPNPTSTGPATLSARIYYPATAAGQFAPLVPTPGGYPVVVFLHGRWGTGSDYHALGEHLASSGFIAVHNNTAFHASNLQQCDWQKDEGTAMFSALQAINAAQGSFLRGALDMSRAAVSGHSLGGASTVRILADNPGYVTGVCLAPWDGAGAYPALFGPRVSAPLLVIHGEGDALAWQHTAQAYFNEVTSYDALKAFVLLGQDCDHTNLVRVNGGSTNVDHQVFNFSAATVTGWLRQQLLGRTAGLDRVLGPPMVGNPRLAQLQSGIRAPKLWVNGQATAGGAFELRLAAAPGLAVMMVADHHAVVPSAFGDLLLDPASLDYVLVSVNGEGALNMRVHVPANPNLVGYTGWFQAITLTDGVGLRLSNLVSRTVVR